MPYFKVKTERDCERSEFYRVMGRIKVPTPKKSALRFNSGPTFRHALEDLMAFITEYPEKWDAL